MSDTIEVEFPSSLPGRDGSLAFPDLLEHPSPPSSGAVGYRFADTGEVWLMSSTGSPVLLAIVP